MKINLGFSPCPNDTFIFDALVHQRIDCQGFKFYPVIADVEELNVRALHGELPMTKMSFAAFYRVADNYQMLHSGAALGEGCGPLLISKNSLTEKEIIKGPVAIPGLLTTANLLLSIRYPKLNNKRVMVFSDIETAVLNDEVKSGLIIHENRFTYKDKGLIKLIDLGEFWENKMGLPIPLGGIAVRKDLDPAIRIKLGQLVEESVRYAMAQPEASNKFVTQHAQEMESAVMKEHIKLYVNHYSIDLGIKGKEAIRTLYKSAKAMRLSAESDQPLFVE